MAFTFMELMEKKNLNVGGLNKQMKEQTCKDAG
jgi:hypothetical protein